jgi:Excreted virulence factor EspC, type VII ESX diderm
MTQPSGEGFAVPTAALTTHATTVDTIADETALAGQAGDQVRLGADAYGQLCQILPSALDPIAGLLVDAARGTGEALHDTARLLRTAAGAYDGTDRTSADRLNGLRGAR